MWDLHDAKSVARVCNRIANDHFRRDDQVFVEGEPGSSMYTVSFGILKYDPGEAAAECSLPRVTMLDHTTVQINEWCCEVALWVDWTHLGTLTATSAELLRL